MPLIKFSKLSVSYISVSISECVFYGNRLPNKQTQSLLRKQNTKYLVVSILKVIEIENITFFL